MVFKIVFKQKSKKDMDMSFLKQTFIELYFCCSVLEYVSNSFTYGSMSSLSLSCFYFIWDLKKKKC